MSFYVLMVWNDIEPELHGPFDDPDERDAQARVLRKEHGNDHGVSATAHVIVTASS